MTEDATQHGEIMKSLGNLEGLNTGILQHLATLNGSVANNTTEITNLKSRADKAEGASKTFTAIWSAVVAFGGLLIAAITLIAYFYKK